MKTIALTFLIIFTVLLPYANAKNRPKQISTSGLKAKSLWTSIDIMAKLEGVDFHVIKPNADELELDSINCASENYYACSFWVMLKNEKKMIVATDGARNFMSAMYENGVPLDSDDSSRIGAKHILCSKSDAEYRCAIIPYSQSL